MAKDSVVRPEHRWPASLAGIAAIALYATLPHQMTLGPSWLAPALELALLVPLTIAVPRRHPDEAKWLRIAAILVIGIMSIANIVSLALVISTLLYGGTTGGRPLILEAMQIWLINTLIFALWYWELDRGGPGKRRITQHHSPDFLFPQMATPHIASPDWRPTFVDYLYLSFTNSTAFSPTDTLPLTPWAKMLMLAQSLISLLTVALVAARAVNILG